jgi:hypothetical protein
MNMANRIIRHGFLDSEKINALSDAEQIFFVRLMLIADDYGLCDARITFLRSHCYPISEIKTSKVEKMLQKLSEVGLLGFYEVEGKQYLEIYKFGQRLRTMRYKCPCPPVDRHLSVTCPPESESESETNPKRREVEEKRKGTGEGEEKQSTPQKAVVNKKIKDGILLTPEEARL